MKLRTKPEMTVERPGEHRSGFVALMNGDDRVTPFEPMRYRMTPRRQGRAGEDDFLIEMDPWGLPVVWRNIPGAVDRFGLFDEDTELLFWRRLDGEAREGDTVTVTQ